MLVQPTNGNVNGIVHKNMKFEDNTFFMAQSQNVLNAKCVENVTLRIIKCISQNPTTNLAAGDNVQVLTVTADGAELVRKLISFEGCKNVTIKRNTYDGG